jgi:protein-S-isoprenylcysteine O-methyltransferase Ste14
MANRRCQSLIAIPASIVYKEKKEDTVMNTPHRHTDETSKHVRELSGEHALTDTGQLLLLAIFLVVWITDSFFFHYSDFPAGHVTLYVRLPVSAALVTVSVLLALRAHRAVFGDSRGKTGLITTGVYSLVRHPMYCGSWLFFVGLTAATLSLASAAVSVLVFVFYYSVSRYEEKLLLSRYGDQYRNYMSRVPMLFPVKLGKFRRSAAG